MITERLKNDRGFTLIEIISVLLIIAIISAVILTRTTMTNEATLRAETDTLKAHLRYAQTLAMNDAPPIQWGIEVKESSYTLVKKTNDADTTDDVVSPFSLPNESSKKHAFSSITATPATVWFDDWGSPSGDLSLTLGGKTITITSNTGFIP